MSNFLEKINNLPEPEKIFFLSDEPMILIKKSFVIYDVDSRLSGKITTDISGMYINEISIDQLPKIISEKTGVPDEIAYGISSEILKKIFAKFPNHFNNADFLLNRWSQLKSNSILSEEDAQSKMIKYEPWLKDLEKENNSSLTPLSDFASEPKKVEYLKISVPQALRDFAGINNQKITSGYINSGNGQYPLQPTLKNWLEDYYREMGAGSHNIIDRGNYLFHGKNSKNLNNEDRQKLAIILKSLSEGVPVLIDREREKIIFPELKKVEKAPVILQGKDKAEIKEESQNFLFGKKSEVKTIKDDFHNRIFDRPDADKQGLEQLQSNVSGGNNNENISQKQATDGIRAGVGNQSIAPSRAATASDFKNQPRFKIQDISGSTPSPTSFSGEQLRKKMMEFGTGSAPTKPVEKIISQQEDEDLGKIEFSSAQVTPTDKMPAPPPASSPTAPRRISPIGRNGNVI